MEPEDKELLIHDLCARFPYGVKCELSGDGAKLVDVLQLGGLGQFMLGRIEVKPYLRSMSSMTEEERSEFYKVGGLMSHKVETDTYVLTAFSPEAYDWLNAHHFDYRGLIEKGLALEALEGMYKN